MATYGGNNSIQDELLFHYDTSNILKSFKGEPVTNLYGDIGTSLSIRPSKTEFSHDNLDIPRPPEKIGKIFRHTSGSLTSTWNGNSYGYSMKDFTVPYDTTYVVSCWIYLTEDCNLDSFAVSLERETPVNTTNVTYDLTKKGTWQRVWQSGFVPSATPNQLRALVYPGKYGVIDGSFSGAYYWGGMQVHEGTYPLPYTPNTRTVTTSLLDLTKNITIDVSNMSFNSSGMFFEDYAEDYINLGSNDNWAIGGNGSIELVVKPTHSRGNNRLFCVHNNSSALDAYLQGNGYNIFMHGGVVGTTTELIKNQYNHVFITYINGTVQIYINGQPGVMTGTTTGYNITNSGTLYIGCYNNLLYNLRGEMPIMKIYNKGFSANQVKRNFRAIRSRFNILM